MRLFLFLLGSILGVNALIVSFRSNFNTGILLVWLLAVALLCYAVFYAWISAHIPLWIKVSAWGLLAVVVAFSVFLFTYGKSDSVNFDEDAVIVLGAGIHGEELSLTLKNRLDAALAYYAENPDAVIVVSGGQGPQEDITEGLAMERYLLANGVPAEKILREERATSTRENFLFSMQLLADHFPGGYRAAFISNDYHVFRAERIAGKVGLEQIAHLHNATPWYTVIPSGLRECLAVIKMWIFS